MRIRRPPVGLSQLLEVVEPAAAFAGFSLAAETLRKERETLGLDIMETARFAKVPATLLVQVLGGRRAFRTPEGYQTVLDRMRAAARFRAREAAGEPKRRPGGWR